MVVVFDNFQDQIMMLDSPLGRVHGYIHEGHSQAVIPVSWLSGCLASMVFVQVFSMCSLRASFPWISVLLASKAVRFLILLQNFR